MNEIALKQSPDGQTWTVELPETKPADKKSADLQAGMLGDLGKTQVFGMPIGSAAGGLLTAGAWDAVFGLVGGKLPAVPSFVGPAVGAIVTKKYLQRWIGEGAANAGALLLTADALQRIFNIRGVLSGLVSGGAAQLNALRRDVLIQAEEVANGISAYYPNIAGRSG